MRQKFGENPKGKRLQRIKSSPNYRNGSFQNIENTAVNPKDVSVFKILKKMLFRSSSVKPSAEIPFIKTNLHELDPKIPTMIWFGHSSYFIQVNGFKILVDPVFSGNVSPVSIFGKAFSGTNQYAAEDIPPLDLLVLTHDHYDHLDYATIDALKQKVNLVVTSLGVGAHLESWGVKSEKIVELDWWEHHQVHPEVKITATPARHFSGRTFKRAQTLWSSFVLELFENKIFLGGDSGYDGSFKKIGKKFGPFDLAFLECGQYGKYWPQIHMFPEETVKAGKDLQANLVIPVHWAKFVLSHHPWNEPIQRFSKAAKAANLNYYAPKPGEAVNFKTENAQEFWWQTKNKSKA